jgi:hypothetical protein
MTKASRRKVEPRFFGGKPGGGTVKPRGVNQDLPRDGRFMAMAQESAAEGAGPA